MQEIENVLAIDVGGKSIKTGFVNRMGLIDELESRPLPLQPHPEVFFEILSEQITLAAATAKTKQLHITAIGIGVPGRVDGETGIAYESTNLQWPRTNFKDLLEEWTRLPVFVEHDVRCGAIAERAFGSLQGHSDFLYVAIGTGIGAGVSVRGELYSGARSFGGELGHTIVYPGGRRCPCGKNGCLEAYCSARNVEARYYESTEKRLTCAEIVGLAETRQCESAQVIWDDATTALAYALVNYSMLLDPTKIVLGGGVAEAGTALLLNPVVSKMESLSNGDDLPALSLSSLKRQSGLIGAGYQVYLRS